MFQEIDVEQMLKRCREQNIQLIDVRSPSEYAEFTIPHSLNIPLFDDDERKEIGILYKQVSVKAAQNRGLEIVSAKLPAYIKQFEQITDRKVVFCWRGGMRSKTTATLLSLMGIRVYRLTGGIRAYRNWVHHILENPQLTIPPCIVISGHTGSGKTLILRKLKEKGYPVLDFEQIAQHRGSIFGHIRLTPHNQKTFDAYLVEQLFLIQGHPYVLMEAESRRIGKVMIPEFLVKHKEQGHLIQVHMPLSERVRTIVEDYQPAQHHQQCMDAFAYIQKRMHTPIAATINAHLNACEYEKAVEYLLEHYYDPRYNHAGIHYVHEPVPVHVKHIDDAVQQIEKYIKKHFPLPKTT